MINARRPYFDDTPDGYVESDRCYLENNTDAAVALLDSHELIVQTLTACVQAFRNVPVVGAVYDRQHSETHIRAMLKAEDMIKALGAL